MCYHYSIAKTAEEIAFRYDLSLKLSKINPEPLFYHVNGFNFPKLPVVYQDIRLGDIKLELMQWGLVPGWIKGEKEALKIRTGTLNARADTIDTKPSFSSAFRHRPCLVPATGYFEWMHHLGRKYPFYIYLINKPLFSFAGIWEEWINNQTGEIIRSFAIITCEANSLTARIHNSKKRMPVILVEGSENKWLDIGSDKTSRHNLLKPCDADIMAANSIGKLISARNLDTNIPEVLEPFRYPGLN